MPRNSAPIDDAVDDSYRRGRGGMLRVSEDRCDRLLPQRNANVGRKAERCGETKIASDIRGATGRVYMPERHDDRDSGVRNLGMAAESCRRAVSPTMHVRARSVGIAVSRAK